jgi:hypothetical protein
MYLEVTLDDNLLAGSMRHKGSVKPAFPFGYALGLWQDSGRQMENCAVALHRCSMAYACESAVCVEA